MPKIKKEVDSGDSVMSNKMLASLKSEIAQFGFDGGNYVTFLMSVGAMKNKSIALKYPNSEMEKYRDMFLKKFEYSVGDCLQLDKFKIMASDQNGKSYETGYFAPRSLWDWVLNQKTV